MFRIELQVPAESFGHPSFRHCTSRSGWLQRRVRAADPELAQRVFAADRSEGLVPEQSPVIEAELARLVPWVERADLRAVPGLCCYAYAGGRRLCLDVWDVPRYQEDARRLAEIVEAVFAETGDAVGRVERDLSLSIGEGYYSAYYVRRLVGSADLSLTRSRMYRDRFDEAFERMVLEGLVASVMRAADPLPLLKAIPAVADLNVCIDRYPCLAETRGPADDERTTVLHCDFSMDLRVRGAWRMGSWALFGAGEVRVDWESDSHSGSSRSSGSHGWQGQALTACQAMA